MLFVTDDQHEVAFLHWDATWGLFFINYSVGGSPSPEEFLEGCICASMTNIRGFFLTDNQLNRLCLLWLKGVCLLWWPPEEGISCSDNHWEGLGNVKYFVIFIFLKDFLFLIYFKVFFKVKMLIRPKGCATDLWHFFSIKPGHVVDCQGVISHWL